MAGIPAFISPKYQTGGILRKNLEENLKSNVNNQPQFQTGGALRSRIQEPLQKELPAGVVQSYLQPSPEAILASLDKALRDSDFTSEESRRLIESIITQPSKKGSSKSNQKFKTNTYSGSRGRTYNPVSPANLGGKTLSPIGSLPGTSMYAREPATFAPTYAAGKEKRYYESIMQTAADLYNSFLNIFGYGKK